VSQSRSALDELLAPFEARPVSRSPDDIERTRREHALGEHLARIQGADDNEAYRRLRELVMLGKATREEVLQLGAEVARRGLFCRLPDGERELLGKTR
jgi:hypothetical protein